MDKPSQDLALNILSTVEDKLDEEINKLDNLDASSLEQLREKRKLELKKQAELRNEWYSKGHGEYTEIGEKEFFNVTKNSSNVVIHFYKGDSTRCKIFDHHLKKLAVAHPETRFVSVNVEKAPFLTDRLKIRIIPTLLVAKESKTKDYIVGFSDLGNCDDFSTERLEWRLAVSGVISYDGDLSQPPEEKHSKKKRITRAGKKTIRETSSSDDDSD